MAQPGSAPALGAGCRGFKSLRPDNYKREVSNLPNHKSAIKRMRQNEKRRLRNKAHKTKVKNAIKKVKTFVENKDIENATKQLAEAVSIIQKVAGKKIIHKNNASRKVSKLTRLVNELKSQIQES